MHSISWKLLGLALLALHSCLAFTPIPRTSRQHKSSTSLFFKALPHDDDVRPVAAEEAAKPIASLQVEHSLKKKKTTITNLWTLNQIVDFLEEDERPTIVKFYAPWCKTCQKLGMHFDRLATVLGDRVIDRKKVKGAVRFAQIEYGPRTKELIEEGLHVDSIPTLQVYLGQNKLFDLSGAKTTKEVEHLLQELASLDDHELIARAEGADDGVLKNAVEEAFYAPPGFLDEEW